MQAPRSPRPCYRFAGFVLSPARRQLVRDGRAVQLVPRYFDLLILLVERRNEAVHRREIMETVWSDVIVSDGALSQAVRTLRRALGDDSRSPSFIRTVSRHGYQFVFPDVAEETEGPSPPGSPPTRREATGASHPDSVGAFPSVPDAIEEALVRLLGGPDDDERREAAETLHALGTAEALRRLAERPGHESARAFLRDARWVVAGAGDVPLLGQPGGARAIRHLVGLRLRLAARLVGMRWGAASLGGAAAGAVAGLVGGLVLRLTPGSDALPSLPVVFALCGSAVGGLGAAGVGAGLAVAEALARSFRGTALVVCGAIGGGVVGAAAHALGGLILEGVFGANLSAIGGGVEGIVIGGATGLGYALSTPRPGGGMATPHAWSRIASAAATGACCAVACVALTWGGRSLGGVSLDILARSFHGSHAGLAPLGRLFGEDGLGPLTRTVLAMYEGLFFGSGLVLGLTRRPR